MLTATADDISLTGTVSQQPQPPLVYDPIRNIRVETTVAHSRRQGNINPGADSSECSEELTVKLSTIQHTPQSLPWMGHSDSEFPDARENGFTEALSQGTVPSILAILQYRLVCCCQDRLTRGDALYSFSKSPDRQV